MFEKLIVIRYQLLVMIIHQAPLKFRFIRSLPPSLLILGEKGGRGVMRANWHNPCMLSI
jgi:hypothetical protein